MLHHVSNSSVFVLYKGQNLIGAGSQAQRFSLVLSRQDHSSIQESTAMEELRVLHLFPKANGRRLPPMCLEGGSTHTVTHFLQQGHTYSNKATLPNSATPWTKHIHTITHVSVDLAVFFFFISIYFGGIIGTTPSKSKHHKLDQPMSCAIRKFGSQLLRYHLPHILPMKLKEYNLFLTYRTEPSI